jgi:hypothetical protein
MRYLAPSIFTPRERFYVLGMQAAAFHCCGVTGFVAGSTLGLWLTLHQQLPVGVLGLLSLTGAAQLILHTWIQKVATGAERLVYYRHEIAIMVVCASVLVVIGQPVLPFLDITLLGVGTFLGFGRLGCYHVGCCHGRPCRIGVGYTESHARAGFPSYFVGVRLFPIQLVEAVLVFATVAAGVGLIVWQYPPGTVLIAYTVVYGTARFVLEFFRGDAERPYWRGFSEAQWTTLALVQVTAALSLTGGLPCYGWHLAAAIVLPLAMAGIALYLRRHRVPVHRLCAAQHVREIAIGLHGIEQRQRAPRAGSPGIPVVCTSLGLQISAGAVLRPGGVAQHYTLSATRAEAAEWLAIDQHTAAVLGRLIRSLRQPGMPFTVEPGKHSGIFHIIFPERADRDRAIRY